MRKVCLTIAGSDSSGGAGIQADIKTMLANGVYAESVITALTAQNTKEIKSVLDVDIKFIEEQIDTVYDDVLPDSVKIGMVSNTNVIKLISDKINEYNIKNVVLDTVMVSTSGYKLIDDEAIHALETYLIPKALIITPNIPEAQILAKIDIQNESDMEKAAEVIYNKYKVNVLIKGGHNINDANDLLKTKERFIWFKGEKVDNKNTHGTGCTLSSAIASNLAKGCSLVEAIMLSKEYITNALKANLNLGGGSGPLDHGYVI